MNSPVSGPSRPELPSALLKALPGLVPSLNVRPVIPRGSRPRTGAGLIVRVTTPAGRARQLDVHVRIAAAPSRVREAIRQIKAIRPTGRVRRYPVLASTFLSPRVREICREEGVGYLDLAGNCLLRLDDFYFEKSVDKNPHPARGRPPSLFAPVSSLILRAFLHEPKRIWSVSALSQATGVSLGHTSNVTRRLVEEAYVVKGGAGLALVEPGSLLDAWRERYAVAAGAQHAYYSFERQMERRVALIRAASRKRRLRYALTSFAAAALVAPFARGIDVLQWYVEDELGLDEWVRALDLRPVEQGPNVLLLLPSDPGVFSRTQTVEGLTLVSDVQLYLDLYGAPSRGKEQAEFLRAQRLKF